MSRRDRSRKADAARLVRLRETLSFTQRELAEELQVAKSAVAMWEREERALPGPVLRLLDLYEAELGLAPPVGDGPRLKTSWVTRNYALSKGAAGVAAAALGGALESIVSTDDAHDIRRRTQTAIARRLVTTLGQQKGLAMKLGQLMSYLPFAVPEPLRHELQVLQSKSEPMAASTVAEIFVEDFGKTPRQMFAEWSPRPLAAASIGQVHRARLSSGEEVAVKVQYPGIARAVAADLANVALVEQIGRLLFRGQEPGVVLPELREAFLEECDYLREATNHDTFRKLFANERGVVIPRAFHAHCSRRVLTTELMRGQCFEDFAESASVEERNFAAEIIYRFAFKSFLQHGVLNADPHPGNYLFRDGEVVFLDFGCVRRFSQGVIENWRRYFKAGLDGDDATIDRLTVEMGMGPPDIDLAYHRHAFKVSLEPWLSEAPVRIDEDYVARCFEVMLKNNPNKYRMSVPKEGVFVNRLQFGVMSVLATLGAELHWRRLLVSLL